MNLSIPNARPGDFNTSSTGARAKRAWARPTICNLAMRATTSGDGGQTEVYDYFFAPSCAKGYAYSKDTFKCALS